MIFLYALVKLGGRFAQTKKEVSTKEKITTVPSLSTPVIEVAVPSRPKEVVDVEDVSESTALKDRENKRKSKPETVPERPKKMRTILLAKKRGDGNITEIHIRPESEIGVYVLHADLTVIEPEAERKIED